MDCWQNTIIGGDCDGEHQETIRIIKEESVDYDDYYAAEVEESEETTTDTNNKCCILCNQDVVHVKSSKLSVIRLSVSFFKQQILINNNNNSSNDPLHNNNNTSRNRHNTINCCFCESCERKIDDLQSLYNQLIQLQESFERRRREMVQMYEERSGGHQQQEEAKSWKTRVNKKSVSTINCYESEQKLSPCRVVIAKLDSAVKKNTFNQDDDEIKPQQSDNNKTYTCPTCQKNFDTPRKLARHLTTHKHQEPKHICEYCSKAYMRPSRLKVHLRTHTGHRPYECSTCQKTFTQSSALRRHLLVHSGVKDYVCSECGKGFNRSDKLKLHVATFHHPPEPPPEPPESPTTISSPQPKTKLSRTCQFCNKTLATRQGLKNHLTIVHKWITKPIKRAKGARFPKLGQHGQQGASKLNSLSDKTCSDCGLVFDRIMELHAHCRKECHDEARKNQCEFCGQCFMLKGSLFNHITRLHHGNNKLYCSICNESFKNYASLARHRTKHTGKAVFPCKYCEAGFNYYRNLNKHLVQAHAEEYLTKSNKIHVCEACWKNFELESQLEEHQRTVHFRCEVCKKLLRNIFNAKRHAIIHTGEKPFPCQYCGKAFNHAANLAEHERLHTGEKRYKCGGCDEGFLRKRVLQAHMQKVHPELWKTQCGEQEVCKSITNTNTSGGTTVAPSPTYVQA